MLQAEKFIKVLENLERDEKGFLTKESEQIIKNYRKSTLFIRYINPRSYDPDEEWCFKDGSYINLAHPKEIVYPLSWYK